MVSSTAPRAPCALCTAGRSSSYAGAGASAPPTRAAAHQQLPGDQQDGQQHDDQRRTRSRLRAAHVQPGAPARCAAAAAAAATRRQGGPHCGRGSPGAAPVRACLVARRARSIAVPARSTACESGLTQHTFSLHFVEACLCCAAAGCCSQGSVLCAPGGRTTQRQTGQKPV